MKSINFLKTTISFLLFLTITSLSWSQTTRTSAATGNWSNTATWVGGVVPVLGDNVVIAAGHTVTLTIGVNIGTGNLTVSGEIALAGFNLTAGSLSGDGNIGSTFGTPTLTVGSNNSNTTFSGVYSGVGANLAKEGTGVLTLSGLNTYTGTTNIRGTISISNIADGGVACNLGQANNSSTNIRLNGGGIQYNGPSASTDRGITQSNTSANSIEVANGSSLTINGAITGEGVSSGFTKLGLGTLILGGTNTYAGTTTISSGTLSIGSGGTIGSVVGNITNNSILIVNRSNAYTYSGFISGTGTLTKEGSGVFTISGANTYTGATTINAGTLQLSTANERISNSSALVIASGATFDMNGRTETVASIAGGGTVTSTTTGTITLSSGGNNSSTTFSGVIQNGSATSIAITKTGSGTLTLTGANTYTGTTTISGGSISIGDGGTTGSIAGNITNNAVLIINRSNAYTYSGVISGTGSVTKEGSGVFTVSGVNTYTGATTINAGTLQLSTGNDRISNSSALTVASGATFDMNGRTETVASIAGAGTITSSAAGAVTLTNGGANITIFSGIIQNGSGTIALTKSGSGTLTLSGANTYTGNTSISAGTLIANNVTAIGAGALVTVSGTGTLQTDIGLTLNRLTISATTAKVNLNGNNSTATRLTLVTAVQPSGTYGSTASAATFKNDSYFTSTSSGVLTVNDCAFSVEVVTTASNQTVSLPLLGNANVTVYWGDGLNNTYTSSGTQTHIYSVAGTYTVNVFGSFTQFGTGTFLATPTRITKVLDWGCTGLTSLPAAFINATGLIDVPNYLPAGVTNLSSTFRGATSFNDPDIGSWNTSDVTNMSSTFLDATAFNQNISNWNTSAVTNMTSMFQNASTFNQDISVWNTAAVTSLNSMFENASAFNQNISSWNTGNVTDLRDVFLNAVAFNQPIGSWNTGNVTSMAYAFKGASSFNHNISNWNTALVTDMSYMFNAASIFNNGGSPDINNWNTGNVTKMAFMFYQAPAFNQPVGGWDMSRVTNVAAMFSCSGTPPGVFNQDISSWNTSSVTNMYSMFVNQSNFNNGGSNTLGNWNTVNVLDMSFMFHLATNFNQNIGNWNTSVVGNMGNMFNGATSFNNGGSGTINSWNTSAVNNMTSMFKNASAFNQNISSWNTGNITSMTGMFDSADAFNQNLGAWNIDKVTDMTNMFRNVCLSTTNYDGILNGWATQSAREANVVFHGGFSYYTAAAATSRSTLIGSSSWTITDGGLDTDLSLSSSVGTDNQIVFINNPIVNITYNLPGTADVSITGLPSGVTHSTSGGVLTISGTPTVLGIFNYTDRCGRITGTIRVNACTVSVASASPSLCPNNTLIPIAHTTTGATSIGTATGLPSGVSASWSNNIITISGTPTESGVFSYVIPLNSECENVNATGSITLFSNCYDWVSTSSTNWNLASNWLQNEVPTENSRIQISATATANLSLDQNRKIESLNLNERGIKVVLGNNNLTINGSIQGENLSSYIRTNSNGSISTTLNNGATKKFPVGQGDYNPVTITNYNTTADSISVRVKDSVLLEAYSGTPVNTVNVQRTWFIKKNNANDSGVDFVFEWDTTQQSGFMPGYYLNHFNGVDWEIADFDNYSQPVKNGSRVTLSLFGYKGGFSPFTFGDAPNSPLPVELLNFNVELKDRVVNLTWQTASEHNNDFFTIERSADGYNFEPILYKDGAGNSNSLLSYSIQDIHPLSGTSYYRLKQTDFDGAYEYSDLRVVYLGEESWLNIYPNPSDGVIHIVSFGDIQNQAIYNSAGALIQNFSEQKNMTLYLEPGIYFVHFEMNNEQKFIKVIIAK